MGLQGEYEQHQHLFVQVGNKTSKPQVSYETATSQL